MDAADALEWAAKAAAIAVSRPGAAPSIPCKGGSGPVLGLGLRLGIRGRAGRPWAARSLPCFLLP